MQLMELYLWKRCFIIHDDFRNFTSPNGFFFYQSIFHFKQQQQCFWMDQHVFPGYFLSVEGLFWITINFQLMFMHSSWIQTAGFHWSTDLLTSTTLLRVMNYFDPMVTPTLKPSRLWSQAFCSLWSNPCWKHNILKQGALFTFEKLKTL